MIKKKRYLALAYLVGFSILSFASQIPQEKMSIHFLYSKNELAKLDTPQYQWLHNGKALLLDTRVEERKRNLTLYNPQTGKSIPVLDPTKIHISLKIFFDEDAQQFIRWPDALDRNGEKAVYIMAGDLYLIEFKNSEVKRLTHTLPSESSAAFSPNGDWVSFIRNNDLYVIDWRTNDEQRLTTDATDTILNGPLSWVYWEEIYSHTQVPYKWSPDSTAIAFLQTDESSVSISSFVHFKPASQKVVHQRYPKAGQVNPKVRLGIVDRLSTKKTWVDCGEYEYLARFKWLPDGKEIAVQTLNRRQSELRLMFAERATGKAREILVDRQPAWINLNYSLYFLKDGRRFIWSSERDGYQHLYLYRLDGQLITQLTKGEFMVVPSGGNYLGQDYSGLVGVDEKKGFVYFTSNQQSLRERHLYRVKMNGEGPTRVSDGVGVHMVGFSLDMDYYFDTYSNASNPPELILHKASGEKISTVSPSAKDLLAPLNLSFPEFYTSKADDGLELPAMMVKPADFSPTKKYPAVIHVYGGPQFQQVVDIWRTRRVVFQNVFAQAGYFVFVLEVRAGMGKSKAIETSVYEQAYGMQNVKDILAGVKWLKQFPYIDSTRLGIWGASGGGCTTLYIMTHSDVFKAGISLYPVSDWHFYDTIYTERYLNTPQNNPKGYKDTSSVLAAANLKGRLLLVHGSYDDNCHPQNTEAFISVLIKNNVQFELMVYPWKKHGIGFFPDDAQVHLHTLMLDFWRRNL